MFFAAWGLTAPAEPQTPFEMAMALERDLASGIGLLMPDPNTPYARYHGALPLPPPDDAGFPQGFLNGLVSAERFGITIYPVALRADDITGVTSFYNANANGFWQETPAGTYHADWLLQLHSDVPPQTQALLCPSHVETHWVFIEEQDIPAYYEALLASRIPSGQGPAPLPENANTPVLRTAAFVPAADAYYFATAWNDVAYFPNAKMDVLFTADLLSPNWTVVRSIPVSNTQRAAAFEVPLAGFPAGSPPPTAPDANP